MKPPPQETTTTTKGGNNKSLSISTKGVASRSSSTTKGKLFRFPPPNTINNNKGSGLMENNDNNHNKISSILERMNNGNPQRFDGGGDSMNLGEFSEFKIPPPPPSVLPRKASFEIEETPENWALTIDMIKKAGGGNVVANTIKQKLHQQQSKNIKQQLPSTTSSISISSLLWPQQQKLNNNGFDATKKRSGPSGTTNSSEASNDKKMEEMDPDVGKMYELCKRLGKGAYGVVWEAIEKRSGRKVALKKIYEAFRNTTDSQRTYREVVFLKAFGHHPNIISVIGGHSAENSMDLYLVFPLLKSDLYKVIEQTPALLTEASTRRIAYQLILALHYLHSAQIIHRDLKPANILLDQDLNVKLADLGLARSLPAEMGARGMDGDNRLENLNPHFTDYVATRWYRPPEIIVASRTYNKPMDMWAFGCILGEMLLKKVIFPGESASHQLELIMKTINPPDDTEIEELCKSIDHQNVDLIKKYLQQRGVSLSDTFINFDCSTVDIIERLLRFTPNERLTVEEVLNHPYIQRERDSSKEFQAPGPFRPRLNDSLKLDIIDYQNVLYDMIDRKQVISDPHAYNIDDFHQHSKKHHHHHYPHQEEQDEFLEEEADSSTETETENYGDNDYHDNEEELFKEISASEQAQLDKNYADYHACSEEYDNEDHEGEFEDRYAHCEYEEEENYGVIPAQPPPLLQPLQSMDCSNFELDISSIPVPQSYRQPPSPHRSKSRQQTPVIIPATKSVSDSSTKIIKDSLKPLSILTLPSSIQRDEEKPEAFKKFELLCQKHDVSMEEYGGDLVWKTAGNIKTPLTVDNYTVNNTTKNSKNNKKQMGEKSLMNTGESHYEYMPQSTFQKAIGVKPMTPMVNNRKGHTKPPTTPNNGSEFDDCDYNKDFHRIQDTMTKNTTDGFVNPYKPKGLKTSAAAAYSNNSYKTRTGQKFDDNFDDDDYNCEDFDDDKDFSEQQQSGFVDGDEGDDNGFSMALTHESSNRNNYNGNRSREALPRIKPIMGSKSFENESKNKRLNDLFPSNEAIQTRIRQIETRVKDRASLSLSHSQSQDSIMYGKMNKMKMNGSKNNSTASAMDGIIMTNGKNGNNSINYNGTNNGRGPTDFAKTKFSFNPYSKVEMANDSPSPTQPRRPFGGRTYNKNFTASFPRSRNHPPHSFSDTEVSVGNKYNNNNNNNFVGRPPPSRGGGYQKNPSTYFPLTQPPPRKQPLQSKVTPAASKNGFSAIHPIPSNNDINIQQQQRRISNGRNNMHSSRYPSFESRINAHASMKDFDKPDSSTIRASELFRLRNSFLTTKGTPTTNGIEMSKYL